MANYGSKDFVFTLTNAGGVAKDISDYIRSINGLDIEALIQESHGFGDEWAEYLYTGFCKAGAVVLDGIYDDAADTPATLWSKGATRVVVMTWGGAKTSTFSVIMQKWNRSPEMEKAHKYQMTLQPTGAVVEA